MHVSLLNNSDNIYNAIATPRNNILKKIKIALNTISLEFTKYNSYNYQYLLNNK